MTGSPRIYGQIVFAFLRDRNLACVTALLITSLMFGRALAAEPASTTAESERLVAAAAKAEAAGDALRAASQLRDAVRLDPENRLAHWQLGEVLVDKNWMRVDDAQRRAANDPRQAEYKERRKA